MTERGDNTLKKPAAIYMFYAYVHECVRACVCECLCEVCWWMLARQTEWKASFASAPEYSRCNLTEMSSVTAE